MTETRLPIVNAALRQILQVLRVSRYKTREYPQRLLFSDTPASGVFFLPFFEKF